MVGAEMFVFILNTETQTSSAGRLPNPVCSPGQVSVVCWSLKCWERAAQVWGVHVCTWPSAHRRAGVSAQSLIQPSWALCSWPSTPWQLRKICLASDQRWVLLCCLPGQLWPSQPAPWGSKQGQNTSFLLSAHVRPGWAISGTETLTDRHMMGSFSHEVHHVCCCRLQPCPSCFSF